MTRRGYHQYCATARTLDLVGERWTLLIVRELLTGPKRFKDLGDSLAGIGTGLLAERLKHLEAAGILRRAMLPPPAATPVYELTPAGQDLEPAVLALARWGLRHAMGPRAERDGFRPGWAVLGMQAAFDPVAAEGVVAVYEFRVGDAVFHARVDGGRVSSRMGPADRPDAVIEADEETFADLAHGRQRLREAVRAGRARATGDRAALTRLRSLFPPPV
ncbi:MAG TPA: winged helix-turn-helix transcriptional regulator [Actinophytocola sp.]|uniref:winged helix-turn-helix transcriptional regulator n=1 Tax=Actinophytocola sp. TaxID=1872138 RepID=UPI002DBD1B4C|nr:winged helix-turn-helix transcriptional regulator [Actinophytocola sp.]HEU5471815.1 winged helix-turn-helix transcriptional regulator [Actinophytocola sp.]